MKKLKQHQCLPTEWEEREKLRSKGQFWTPSWVANAMITYVSQETDMIFDPASGEGAFYEALKVVAPQIKFYGTDIGRIGYNSFEFSLWCVFDKISDFQQTTVTTVSL